MNTFLSMGKFKTLDSSAGVSYKYGIWHLPDGRWQVMLEFDREGEEPRCHRCRMSFHKQGDKMDFLTLFLEEQVCEITFGRKPHPVIEMAAIGKEMFDREFAEFEMAFLDERVKTNG